MTDDRTKAVNHTADSASGPPAPPSPDAAGDETPPPEDWTSWSNLWQVPAILVSVALIATAIVVAARQRPPDDFAGALDQVSELIDAGKLDVARTRLSEVIEPRLAEAPELDRAGFHAVQGDWVDAFQRSAGARSVEHDRSIAEQYARAQELGLPMSPRRLEQWAMALIWLRETDRATRLLEELEAISLSEGADSPIRQRRNRVMRTLIGRSLSHWEGSYASLMDVLDRYRADELIGPDDRLWAVARQAELRIADSRFAEAVDRLLVESRRLERRAEASGTELDFSEIHTLLGEGYYHLGQRDYAEHHLNRALELAPSSHPTRGAARLLLGDIAVGDDRLEEGLRHYDEVLQNFLSTAAELPARLGRAEVLGVLGDHERSLVAFAEVGAQLARAGSCCGVDAARVTDSLLDRSSAALASGRLERALRHLQLADGLWPPDQTPGAVLLQLGAVHRQIADRSLADASAPASSEPALRLEAQDHYRQAGDALVRHVRAVAGAPNADDLWASSLWEAAACYDLAGDLELAIKHFHEYLAGRAEDDPRRPAALFGLAQAQHALQQYDDAIANYDQLIEQFPRTNEAYGSYVLLARARVAVGQPAAARQLLHDVVLGNRGLDPKAQEYREALIELGKLLEVQGDAVAAIERLTEAAERYPDDPRIHEIRFRLASSYRLLAKRLADELGDPTLRTSTSREPLRERRHEALKKSAALFAAVKVGLGTGDLARLDHLDRSWLRSAFIYEADCVFELGEYEQAIGLYEQVVRQYPEHYDAMNAMVQIVNCYTQLGDSERARQAHERALVRLVQLPDSAFESSEAVLNREAWQQWLSSWPLGQMQSAVN